MTNFPNFTLASSHGNDFTLSDCEFDYALIYFYPKDDTPGCTVEAQDFTRLANQFKNCQIIGISPDNIDSHCKFIDKYSLSVLLLSDEDKKLATNLKIYKEKNMYGKITMGIERSTFLVRISTLEIIQEWRNVRAKGHAERVLNEISSKL